jgi:hypothetical protein
VDAMKRVPIGGTRILLWSVALGLIGIYSARLLSVVPDWLAGIPPSYPGRYETRASSALTGIALMLTPVVNTWPGPPTWRRHVGVAALLVTAWIGIYWLYQLP